MKQLSLGDLWECRERAVQPGEYELAIQLLFARNNGLPMTDEERGDLEQFLARPAGANAPRKNEKPIDPGASNGAQSPEPRPVTAAEDRVLRRAAVGKIIPHPDTVLLDFVAAESLDLVAFAMPTGAGDADVGWKVLQHHMGEKAPREVGVAYRDDPREAIREAMRSLGVPAVEAPSLLNDARRLRELLRNTQTYVCSNRKLAGASELCGDIAEALFATRHLRGAPRVVARYSRDRVLRILRRGVDAGFRLGKLSAEAHQRVKERALGVAPSQAPTTYTPSREVVQQALDLVDKLRDAHAHWGGWSGTPAMCERITYMLRYGKSPDAASEVPHG